jgi:putative ABC transport system permease protein
LKIEDWKFSVWFELLKDFYRDLKANRLRAILTLIALTWGTVSVVLLLAFGEGLGHQMQAGMMNAGDRIMIVYGYQTGLTYEGLPKGRRIRLVEDDVDLLKRAIPQIAMASPQYRNNVTLTYGRYSTTTECEGVNASFEDMRRMYPVGGGRFLNDVDVAESRRTIFLGVKIAADIFGSANPMGKMLTVDGIPFTVVGIMQKKVQTAMNNGPDANRAIIPYTTFRTMYGNQYVNTVVIRPSDPSNQSLVKSEIYRVLGRKYHFDPDDDRALRMWDFIESEKIGQKVFLGIQIFLGSIGFLTLLIAGVGVANVMYVVVKERTKEIGIKLAIGARKRYILAQFIFEALSISLLGGGIGILFSWGIVSLMHTFPAEEGAMQFLGRPILSGSIMLLTSSILTAIGLAAGIFPARKAANVDPVESLRYE